MNSRLFGLLAAVVFVTACQSETVQEKAGPAPSPIFFQISNPDGSIEGWLFGTIHALPDGVEWRTDALTKSVRDADMLMVEIAELDNSRKLTRLFATLSTDEPVGPIRTRVGSSRELELVYLIQRSNFEEKQFNLVETWAAALMLSQLAKTGKSENGVDKAIIGDFAGRTIKEFEGPIKQLRIFDDLPEREQRDLIHGVMDDIARSSEDPGALTDVWLSGDEAALVKATQTGILADPEIYEALLAGRNRDWIDQLIPVLESGQEPLIAVGAGHLVGKDGLPAMLQERGYIVERVE